MTSARSDAAEDATPPPVLVDPEHGMPPGFGPGAAGKFLFWIAVGFSLFQVATAFNLPLDRKLVGGVNVLWLLRGVLALWAVWLIARMARGARDPSPVFAFVSMLLVVELLARFGGSLPSQVVRALHVGFLCLVAGGLLAAHRATSDAARALAWVLAAAGFVVGLYHWHLYADLVNRAGEVTQLDLVVGCVALVVLFIICWRFLGPALPIVAGLFLAYCLLGQYLPRPLDHRGFSLEQVIEHMSFGTEGIYAVPTLVSSTYIFLFILFGAFLERAGMIQLFTDIAMGLFGGARGGPAKVAVLSSALMGTISGSGVANVVSTGQFTIPLMKRFGYAPAFAGGVEATASMGGQIMPPVMGAVAFIMAETIGVPYAKIVEAAIIPALLYYLAAFVAVHLEAGRKNLVGLPQEMLPSALGALMSRWHLILPLAVLVYLLFAGYTPLFSGSVGLALTIVLILGGSIALGFQAATVRALFWIGLGLLCGTFFWFGILAIVAIIVALIVANLFVRGGRLTIELCRDALADGARQAIPVGVACAVVGLVIGTMTLTGAGTVFGGWVVSIGKDSLALALLLTMVVSLLLGMGIPTIPNYIITSSLAAPVLLKLDVPLIVSHMFVFYFGIMADLTPPVALAAFAAAPIARESGMKIGMQALRIALAGFVIPFMAVYNPELMLQPAKGVVGFAYVVAVVWIVAKAACAILLWGAASIGYLRRPMRYGERVIAALAAGLIAIPVSLPASAQAVVGDTLYRNSQLVFDLLGLALAAAFVFMHLRRGGDEQSAARGAA